MEGGRETEAESSQHQVMPWEGRFSVTSKCPSAAFYKHVGIFLAAAHIVRYSAAAKTSTGNSFSHRMSSSSPEDLIVKYEADSEFTNSSIAGGFLKHDARQVTRSDTSTLCRNSI